MPPLTPEKQSQNKANQSQYKPNFRKAKKCPNGCNRSKNKEL